jgi:hypothetical protein
MKDNHIIAGLLVGSVALSSIVTLLLVKPGHVMAPRFDDGQLKSLVNVSRTCEDYVINIERAPSAAAIGMTNVCASINKNPAKWMENQHG